MESEAALRVGLVGAGDIGAALGANALAAGFAVSVADPRTAALAELCRLGASAASSPAEVGRRADAVQVAVLDDAQARQVVLGADGLLATLPAGAVILIHSTVRPATVRDLAGTASGRGVHVLDAAITDPAGSRGIRARTASFLVGGDAGVLARVRPLLECSAKHVFHLGDVGAGLAAKIVRNAVMYVTLLAAFEGRRLASVAGIDRATLREVLAASGASSEAMAEYLGRTAYGDDYRARLPVLHEIFAKDLGLALDLAADGGLAADGIALARERIAAILAPDA